MKLRLMFNLLIVLIVITFGVVCTRCFIFFAELHNFFLFFCRLFLCEVIENRHHNTGLTEQAGWCFSTCGRKVGHQYKLQLLIKFFFFFLIALKWLLSRKLMFLSLPPIEITTVKEQIFFFVSSQMTFIKVYVSVTQVVWPRYISDWHD